MNHARRKSIGLRSWCLGACLNLFGSQAAAEPQPPRAAPRRLAFIVGNATYQNDGWLSLPGPLNDAEDLARKLTLLGYEVFGPHRDLTRDEFYLRNAEFIAAARTLQAGDLVVVFYAGHGASVGGESFVVPVDMPGGKIVPTLRAKDWARLAIPVEVLLDKLRRDGLISVLFLNNCQNAFPSLGGIARLPRPSQDNSTRDHQGVEMLISYATAPGQFALPARSGQRNTPYGAALLRHLGERGLELRPLMRKLAADVAIQAGDYQRPTYDDWLKRDHYLAGQPRVWQRRWFLPVTTTLGTVVAAGLVVGLTVGLRDDRQVYQPSFPK